MRCESRLENAPLPHDVKTPYLFNREHCLSELIVKNLHTELNHKTYFSKANSHNIKAEILIMPRQKLCQKNFEKLPLI